MRTEDIPLTLFGAFWAIVGVAFLLPPALQALGLPWAPFAAWVCARSARKKGLDVRRHAVAGALYSALLFWPWVYFILRMNGRNVPVVLIRLFYISVYASWMLGFVIITLGGAIAVHPGIERMYEFSNPKVVASYFIYCLFIANLVMWFVSLVRFLKRRRANPDVSRADALIDREYLTPPALMIATVTLVWTLSMVADRVVEFLSEAPA